MTPRIVLSLSLFLLSINVAAAQRRDSDSTDDGRTEYWNRFETEFNRFITRAVDGFKDPESFNAPADSFLYTQSFDSSYDSDSWEDGRWENDRWTWHRSSAAGAKFARFGIPRRVSWLDERTKPSDVLVRYNRVEGLFLGLGTEKKYYWRDGREFTPYGSGGYAFRAHRWWGNLALARQIALGSVSDRLLEFGVEGYVVPDSKDSWIIGEGENTAASFLIHEDFRDYFERRGFALHGAFYYREPDLFAEASLTYLIEQDFSLEDRTDWALFGGSKTFRPNPSITDGKLRSAVVRAGLSTVMPKQRGQEGWDIHTTGEFSGRSFGGDFVFEQYVVDVRRYQPLSRFDNINLRLRAGTAHGDLPLQRTFEMGGLGTLPGYRFKDFPGDSSGSNRMLLFNAEYMLNADVLHDLSFWPSFLMRQINLLFIADAGLLRRADASQSPLAGFGGLTWGEMRTDVGVGLCSRSGSWRIGAAWRTDRAEAARLFLRISQPF